MMEMYHSVDLEIDWENNIKMDLKDMIVEGLVWINLV
jgi:hypothetical protein